MGLDNGIVVKTYFTNGMAIEKEVCYWRKWWGLRNKIVGLIGLRSDDQYDKRINIGDITDIKELLINITRDKDYYGEYCNLYYSPESFIINCYSNAARLDFLLMYLHKDFSWIDFYEDELENFCTHHRLSEDDAEGLEIEKIEVRFYDSY